MTHRLPEQEVLALWDAGMSAKAIGAKFGVSDIPPLRILKRSGRDTKRSVVINADIKFLHLENKMSVKAIAKKLGIPRANVVKWLNEHGIQQRNRSEAMFERMKQSTAEMRQHLTKKAHDAVRGTKRTIEVRESTASTKYKNQKLSMIERTFLQAFKLCEIDIEPQFPIGKWNCDFAIVDCKIDIEIDPGNWHSSPLKQRYDSIRDAELKEKGWTVIRWNGKAIRKSNPNLLDHALGLIRSQLCSVFDANKHRGEG